MFVYIFALPDTRGLNSLDICIMQVAAINSFPGRRAYMYILSFTLFFFSNEYDVGLGKQGYNTQHDTMFTTSKKKKNWTSNIMFILKKSLWQWSFYFEII